MIQNIIALIIVFSTLAYVVFSVFHKSKRKHLSKCDGCSGCELKSKFDNRRIDAKSVKSGC